MTDEEVIALAISELTHPDCAVTEQYLELHKPVYENGQIKISRIDREKPNVIQVFIPVEDEYFSFCISIYTETKKASGIYTEPRNIVRFRVTSDTVTSDEMQSYLKLQATDRWNKGDTKRIRKKFSCLEIEPNPEPDEFEDKIKKLLAYLQQDIEGIHNLKKQDCYICIDVTTDFHYGNQMLGRLSMDEEDIANLNRLGLPIIMDVTAWGNPFK